MIAQNRNEEAERLAREALAIHSAALPEDHPWRLSSQSVLGGILAQRRKFQEAERLLVASYQRLTTRISAEAWATALALERVIDLYERWAKPEKAAAYRALRKSKRPPLVRGLRLPDPDATEPPPKEKEGAAPDPSRTGVSAPGSGRWSWSWTLTPRLPGASF